MEIWFVITVSACIAALLNALFSIFKSNSNSNSNLPPGPRGVPIISITRFVTKPSMERYKVLKELTTKLGPVFALYYGSRPMICINSRTLAHQALIRHGNIFAERAKTLFTLKIITSNNHSINSAVNGPTWRVLRRNLTSQMLHPLKIKQFSSTRKWGLDILLSRLKREQEKNGVVSGVDVIDEIRFAMFRMAFFMAFGEKPSEIKISEIMNAVRQPLVSLHRYNILTLWPKVTHVLFRSRRNEVINMRKKFDEILIPYVRGRKNVLEKDDTPTHYVDTLFDLELSESENVKRKLSEEQIITVCSEFLTSTSDTISAALQWIMAELVTKPNIQAKLFAEIERVVGEKAKEVGEDHLAKMPYLKAVVLEGLRRHPPLYFAFPHFLTEEVELGGYTLPKHSMVNFMISEINRDPEVWDDPMEFKPERFMTKNGNGVEVDVEFNATGSQEIKMMPFGAGRRMCPAVGFAILHMEYYLANLVRKFEWNAVDGQEVDFTMIQEFTIVMKNPLRANVFPR